MIANIEITGVNNYSVDNSARKYIMKKIGSLDRLAPRHARKTMHADVKVAQIDQPRGNKYEIEVIITVPDKVITAKDSTMNVMAATDIVVAKLSTQLHKYKELSVPHVGRRRLLDRFKRGYGREQQQV